MPDKTPRGPVAASRRPTCAWRRAPLRTGSGPDPYPGFPFVPQSPYALRTVSPCQEPFGASRVLRRISSCMPRPVDSAGPPHPRHERMLPCCLRRSLTPSASGMALSKLYQHFRVRDHPCGLQDSLSTLNLPCSWFIHSATGPRLDTGGWLTLARRGLPPRKMRQALPGAITQS